MEPFSRVGSQRCLIETLNKTFDQQQAKWNQSDQRPSSAITFSSPVLESGTSTRSARFACSTTSSTWWTANLENNEKENGFNNHSALSSDHHIHNQTTTRDSLLINKRQLINSLNSAFLGEAKTNLIERVHEFTDSAYTKHEHREIIVLLLQCIKMLLNRFVKLLYKLVSKQEQLVSALEWS